MNELNELLSWLTPQELAELDKHLEVLDKLKKYDWRSQARPEQLPPDTDWTYFMYLAGRGAGKTRSGAEWVRDIAMKHGRGCRIALVAPTAADVRDVMIEGESGLLAVHPDGDRPTYYPSKRKVAWPNGAVAFCYSAEKPERFRGPQHHFCWADELAAWKYLKTSWDLLELGLRLGEQPQMFITTTPRPLPIIKELAKTVDGSVVLRQGTTYDNRENLPKRFFDRIVKRYEGTRLGRQEIEGHILDDNPGALWSLDAIDALRVDRPPTLTRIVVAIDPAVSANEGSNETGVVVVGKDAIDHGYLLEDLSGVYAANDWAKVAIAAYHRWQADRIIGEVNNGGDLIEAVLRSNDANIPYSSVRASRGKVTRAEPVAALTEQGRSHHVGAFPQLEDQLTLFMPDGWLGEGSPDRGDAYVWGMTELLLGEVEQQGSITQGQPFAW